MKEKEYDTLNNFVNSNDSFYNAIKNKEKINPDTYLSFELLILYFKINYEFVKKLNQYDYNLITDLIKNNNFTIENNVIVYKDKYYSISYFMNLLNTIENIKNETRKEKIIKLNLKPKDTKDKKTKNSKVIDLSIYQRSVYFTMKEREYFFERSIVVDDITKPFIFTSNMYFKELLNYLIMYILEKKIDQVNYKYLELLYSYIFLYPFTCYANGKEEIHFEKLDIPKNEIGLRKSTYKDDEYLRCLEDEMQELSTKHQRLKNQKETMKKCLLNYEAKVHRIDEHICAIEKKQIDNLYSQHAYKNTDEIYNANLLAFITKSFEQGNIYINESFEDPVLKFFYIENNEVLFYCAMHLKTLLKIFDSKTLLPISPKGKKLKLAT